MNLAQDAFEDLFPDKELEYQFSLKYTKQFKPYNANVRKQGKNITFHLSHKWKTVSREIQIGLLQELLSKLFKAKKGTVNKDLYHHFMKKIHIAAPKVHTHPVLEESFNRNNELFFHGLLEKTNLKWGTHSVRQLGLYEYGSDTITISKIFIDENQELLDYVMYHEMLHKHLKFECKKGKSHHHTPEFRRREALFPESKRLEQELSHLARKKRQQASSQRFFPSFFTKKFK